MKDIALHFLICTIAIGVLLAASEMAVAQSQALNGQIEGTILDQNNAVVPNAVITVTNIETGATRTVTTDESGVYRFPLLPLVELSWNRAKLVQARSPCSRSEHTPG